MIYNYELGTPVIIFVLYMGKKKKKHTADILYYHCAGTIIFGGLKKK